MAGRVFFNRMRPWSVDIVDVLTTERRLVVGYPVTRNDLKRSDDPLAHLVNPWDAEHRAYAERLGASKAQYSKLRNFVRKVSEGDVVLVPRPQRGVIYAAIIDSEFGLTHVPARVDYFRAKVTRESKDCVDGDHVAEMSQGWDVQAPITLPWSVGHGWIRRSLFGMSSYNFIESFDGHDPHQAIRQLMSGLSLAPANWTSEPNELGVAYSTRWYQRRSNIWSSPCCNCSILI